MLFVSGFPPALRRLVVASLESPWIPKRFHKVFKGPKEGYSRNQSEQAMEKQQVTSCEEGMGGNLSRKAWMCAASEEYSSLNDPAVRRGNGPVSVCHGARFTAFWGFPLSPTKYPGPMVP